MPFVFYNLDKLKIGDKIYIVNDKDETLAFVVRSIKSFDRTADATTIFASSDGLAHLNLITCEGTWNQVNGNYPQRLVIFTDAITAEGAAPAASVFNRSLGIGAQGADVVALQTALQQKGFLTMPPGVTYGFFGALTTTAVSNYQTSVGLPRVGIFGPLTRAKFALEATNKLALPNTGANPAVINLPASPQDIVQSLKSLYATPVDGVITSSLLGSIVFMAFVIIRRRGKRSF